MILSFKIVLQSGTVFGPVVAESTAYGYKIGIAVKRMLDACAPTLRIGEKYTITVERIDNV